MKKPKWIVRGLAALLVAALQATVLAQTPELEDGTLDSFFKKYLDEHFQQQPMEATRLGDHRFDGKLDDISPAARAGWVAFARATLKDLPKQVDYNKLSRDGQIDF